MQDKSKDRYEAGAAWALESTLSLIPVVGPAVGLALAKTIAVADAERVQGQIKELYQLLSDATDNNRIALAALQTDEFLANLHFVIRQLQETSEVNKRSRLKRALVTGAERRWLKKAEQFTRTVARIEEPHIEALVSLYEIADGTHRRVRDGTVLVQKKRSVEGFHRSENYYKMIFEQLAAEGLVVIDSPAEQLAREQRYRPRAGSPEESFNEEPEGSTLKLTNTGISFLAFLRQSE